MINLKPQIYYGIDREQLEFAAGDLLPKKAVIWFAYRQKIKLAENEYKYGIVVYYEFQKRFYGIMAGRVSIGGEFLPWKRESFMFNADNSDPQWRLETELLRANETMNKQRENTGNTDKSVFEDVLERMIERERLWQEEA